MLRLGLICGDRDENKEHRCEEKIIGAKFKNRNALDASGTALTAICGRTTWQRVARRVNAYVSHILWLVW